MKNREITADYISEFTKWLHQEEKSEATIEKYIRDVRAFSVYCGNVSVSKSVVMDYKKHLLENGYAVRSINSMLASIHKFFAYLQWEDCKVKTIRTQRQIYCPEEKNLTKSEYMRLLKASEGNDQLNLVLQTICSTGIRVSELKYFTVEAVRRGGIRVSCKNKTRTIFVPGKLKNLLLSYAGRKHIRSGQIFLSRSGKPLDRTVIWAAMKRLCQKAQVMPSKVFPHNLRKLFARTFYAMEKDIAKLADILGHSSIDTTRIYIVTTGMEHRKKIEQLGLLL